MSDQIEQLGAEPVAPEQPAPDYGGATPEEIQNALNIARGLSNLDTRHDVLGKLVRDDVDAQFLRSKFGGEPEEPRTDPIEEIYGPQPQILGYDAQGQPVYDQPVGQYQPEAFDPRSLAPVFDAYGQEIEQRVLAKAVEQVRGEMLQQASQQALTTGVQQAVTKHGLSEFDQSVVNTMADAAMKNGDRRSPAEIADAIALQLVGSRNQQFVNQGGVPVQSGSAAPGGPVPGESTPRSIEEALRAGGGLR